LLQTSNVIFAKGLSPDKIREIEKRLNARIGVSVIQEDSKAIFLNREPERFPMASTFKTFACAAQGQKKSNGSDALFNCVAINYSNVSKPLFRVFFADNLFQLIRMEIKINESFYIISVLRPQLKFLLARYC
jgi:hypothetical protein